MIGPYGVGAAGGPDRPTARRARPAAAGFSVADGAEASETAAAEPAGGTGAVGGAFLLGWQEREADEALDRLARTRLREVIAELAGLQREMLRGGIARATLERLARVAQDVPVPADAALRMLLASGMLRVRLELARYEAFRPRGGE